MATLLENVNIIKEQVSRMKTALDLPQNTPLEDVTTTLEEGGGKVDIVNGTVEGGFYAKSGTIEPYTFVNTSVMTSLTTLSITGTYNDVARLDDDHCVIVSHSSSTLYVNVFKGTSRVAQTSLSTGSSATYNVCTAEDGVNIFVLIGGIGYESKVVHYTFNNNSLTKIAEKTTEGKSTNYYMYSLGISYLKLSGTTHTCLIGTKVDDWCYCGVAQFTGSSITCGSLVGLHDNHNYGMDFGGFAKISDTAALVCVTNITNSSGNTGVGAYRLSISGTTITKTALSGSPTRQPKVFRVNDKLILVANRETSTYNVIIDKYTISGSSVTYNGAQTVGYYGTSTPYVTAMEKIDDTNFLLAHTYYDSSSTLKYRPCVVDGTSLTFGTEVGISQSATNFKKIIKTGGNKLQLFFNNSVLTGTLSGLTFEVGVKFVTPASGSIDGITKTVCSTGQTGEIWKL